MSESKRTSVDDFVSELEAGIFKERLPAFIKFTVAPYHGLGEREITLRMGVILSGYAPYNSERNVGNEALNEELAFEFKGILEDKLADCEAPIYIGSI